MPQGSVIRNLPRDRASDAGCTLILCFVVSQSGADGRGDRIGVERLSPNWTRAVPRLRTGGASHILRKLAHGRSHAVVLESKRSPRRLGGSP
jgi:hypothetical protein